MAEGSSGSSASAPPSGLSSSTFSNAGGAVSDIFSASALRTKGKGSRIEAQEYDLAAELARKNAQFVETSTNIKQFQIQRGINQTLGQQQADVAGAGFSESGTALDLLADSARQGALTKAVAENQGVIEETGYKEQAASYELMSSAARMAADADEKAAKGAGLSAALKGGAAGASAGAMFGPWGAVIGGAVGATAGYLGSK